MLNLAGHCTTNDWYVLESNRHLIIIKCAEQSGGLAVKEKNK